MKSAESHFLLNVFIVNVGMYYEYGSDLYGMSYYYYCDLLYQLKLNFSMNSGIIIINNWFKFFISAYLGFFRHLGIS
jgi:hypothetical protein